MKGSRKKGKRKKHQEFFSSTKLYNVKIKKLEGEEKTNKK